MALHNPYKEYERGMDDAYMGLEPKSNGFQYQKGYQRTLELGEEDKTRTNPRLHKDWTMVQDLALFQYECQANFFKQTKLVNEGKIGNCMMTCFSNYFKIPVNELPPIEELFPFTPTKLWEITLECWLESLGYTLCRCLSDPFDKGIIKHLEIYFAAGDSVRGNYHIIMMANGEFLFDPHPDNSGVSIREFWYLKKT